MYMSISWWRHQMETFSTLLALCAGNSPVTGEFPAQRPVTRSFDVFFDLRLNKRLSNNCEAGDLRRHRTHYDVIVMFIRIPLSLQNSRGPGFLPVKGWRFPWDKEFRKKLRSGKLRTIPSYMAMKCFENHFGINELEDILVICVCALIGIDPSIPLVIGPLWEESTGHGEFAFTKVQQCGALLFLVLSIGNSCLDHGLPVGDLKYLTTHVTSFWCCKCWKSGEI